MEQGRAYTQADLDNIPKIREDGSVDSPDVISPEQAEKIDQGLQGLPDTVIELDAPAKAEGAKNEDKTDDSAADKDDNSEKGIVLDKEAAKTDEVVKIGGEEFKKADLLKEAEAFADVDLSQASEKTKDSIIQMYVDHKHKDAWQKTNTKKAEENAAVRKENESAKREIEHRRRTLKTQEQTLTKQAEALKILAEKDMTEDEVYDENNRVILSKQREFNKIQDAREQLPDVQERLKQTQQEVAQTDIDRTLADVEALIAVHPEYQFEKSQSLREAMKRYEDGSKEDEDADKLIDLYSVIDMARDYGLSIDKAFDRLSRTGRLAVTATQPTLPDPKPRITEAERLAAAIAKKQKGAQFIDPNQGKNERTVQVQKVSIGDKMREAALRSRGLTSSPALEKSGY